MDDTELRQKLEALKALNASLEPIRHGRSSPYGLFLSEAKPLIVQLRVKRYSWKRIAGLLRERLDIRINAQTLKRHIQGGRRRRKQSIGQHLPQASAAATPSGTQRTPQTRRDSGDQREPDDSGKIVQPPSDRGFVGKEKPLRP